MKNLIVNIFKTLFFFDLSIIVIYSLPEIAVKSASYSALIREALALAVIIAFTVFYYLAVEKRKTGITFNGRIFKPLLIGFTLGALPLLAFTFALKLLKMLDFTVADRPEKFYIWIAAIFCNALAAELLLRGYLFRLYRKHYGFMGATVITVLLFLSLNTEIFSASKLYIANMVLFNLLLCFLLELTGTVATTVFVRFFYTCISCCMLGGLSPSGEYPTLLKLEYTGKAIITGGANGPEGSAVILGLAVLTLIICAERKYRFLKRLRHK